MKTRITDAEFRRRFACVSFPGDVQYRQLDGYTHSHTNMRFMCDVHGEFLKRPASILKGSGCPSCSMRPRYTVESFVKALRKSQLFLTIQDDSFIRLSVKATFKCEKHGTFERKASETLKKGCPSCSQDKANKSRVLGKAVWDRRIREKHGDTIRMLGQFRGAKNHRHRFKCYVCFNTWKAYLAAVGLKGSGCPHCAHQKKSKGGFRVKEYERDGVLFRVQGYEYQAICWILDNKPRVKAGDILTESSSRIPVIRYKFGRRYRNYYPDLFIPKYNRIVEVKSNYTLGLSTFSRRSQKMWRQNQAKAKSALASGYRFTLLLMTESGSRFVLPKNWHNMKKEDVMTLMAVRNGDFVPSGTTRSLRTLSLESERRLRQELFDEKQRNKT